MRGNDIFHSAGVVSFDQAAFDEACSALMHVVLQDGRPDLLIGIRTGGLHVARGMAAATGGRLAVLPVTCRRPSSKLKSQLGPMRKLIAGLPRPVTDRLRVIEHGILTRSPSTARPQPYEFDSQELHRLDEWQRLHGKASSVVVVDDAVDSGATLSSVMDLVSKRMPFAAVRSAVITVTTPNPWVSPRYTLYRRQLCRFPWSMDA